MKKTNELLNYIKYMHLKSKGYRRFIPLIFISSLILSAVSILIALMSKQLIDSLLTLHAGTIIKVISISVSGYILGAVIRFGTAYMQKYFVDKYKMKLQLGFYDNMQRSEFVFFNSLSSSDIYYRMFTDISIMVDFYINLIINIPTKIITFITAMVIMCMWSYELTLAIIGLVFLQLIIMIVFKKPIRKRAEISIESDQRLIAKINDDVIKSDMCRSLSLEKYNYNIVTDYFDVSRINKLKSTRLHLVYSSLLGLTNQILNICILLLGVYFVSTGKLTIGTLMAISMLAGFIYQPLNEVFTTVISYQPTKVSFRRFNEFDSKIDSSRENGKKVFVNGDITISNLFFTYGDKPVICDKSFIIKQGQLSCIKGENGIGKTTLARLFSRYISAQNGSISINNDNILDVDFDLYRQNVIPVFAESILINDTMKNNILLGASYSDEEVNRVIEECSLTGFIAKLPDGIDTMLETGDKELSKGEIQKISLARALIRRPSVLILDEPLSHVDQESVDEFLLALKLYNNEYKTTIIIISHDNRVDSIVDESICI